MDELLKKLSTDLATEVMARENSRRSYQGDEKTERVAYHTGRIEYIQTLMDFITKMSKQ